MKSLKDLLFLGTLLFVNQNLCSQFYDKPALIEFDAKRKQEKEIVLNNSKNDFMGEVPLDGELRNKCQNSILTSYFRKSESQLNKNDSIDLENYLNSLGDKTYYFQVRGYASVDGKNDFNYLLSSKRAKEYEKFIKSKNPDAYVELVCVGESGSESDMLENRKVEIIPNEPSFYTALKNSSAKYFLVDLSGSMRNSIPGTNIPKYLLLRKIEFPKDSRIFGFFSGEVPRGSGMPNLENFYPRGSSEVYGSAKDLIEKVVEEGESLEIFTDGISTDPQFGYKDVVEVAKGRNIKVSISGVGIPRNYVMDFMNLALETGGDYSVSE